MSKKSAIILAILLLLGSWAFAEIEAIGWDGKTPPDGTALIGAAHTELGKNSTPARNANIQLACQAFDGKMIRPGEQVSFNAEVGPRTFAEGYEAAAEMTSGQFVDGVGGGVCQVSSTLFQAVAGANIRIRERTSHAIPLGYVEMGADATVSDGRIDFVFENDTGAPIYLRAGVDTEADTCYFEIYGRPDPDGYTYSLRHETLEKTDIPEAVTMPDREKQYVTYEDETYAVSQGSPGYIVRTYLVTKDASGGIVQETELYVDTYHGVAPVIYKGTQTREA